jgi:hypothetical protein
MVYQSFEHFAFDLTGGYFFSINGLLLFHIKFSKGTTSQFNIDHRHLIT